MALDRPSQLFDWQQPGADGQSVPPLPESTNPATLKIAPLFELLEFIMHDDKPPN
jgi:hypothetical protein